jgi:hypothetical protein
MGNSSNSYVIEEMWVINQIGENIYNSKIVGETPKSDYSTIIAAVNHLSKNFCDDSLRSVLINQTRFSCRFIKQSNLIIVCRANKEVGEAKIETYLDKIQAKILNTFKSENDSSKLSEILNINSDKDNLIGIKLSQKASKSIIDQL